MTDPNTPATGRHHAEDAPAPADTDKEPRHSSDGNAPHDSSPNNGAPHDGAPDNGLPEQGPTTTEEKIDEWGEETFPASDPPANY